MERFSGKKSGESGVIESSYFCFYIRHGCFNFKKLLSVFFYHLNIYKMNSVITEIKKAAEGLLFLSESDHPFEIITFSKPNGSVEDHLKKLAKKDSPVETQTLEYFFRNMSRINEGDDPEQQTTAKKFQQLQIILNKSLKNIMVYRIGSVQVDAFIIGELPDGSYAGLRTLLIET